MNHEKLGSRMLPSGRRVDGVPPTTTVLVVQLAEPIVDRTQRRRVVETLNRAAAGVQGGDVIVAGVAAVTLELEDAARRGLPRAAVISLVLVLGWLFLFLRSLRRVLMALLPLVFAAAVTVLFIMATGQRLNPINAVALPLLAGIAVDAGLFLLAASPERSSAHTWEPWRLRATVHAVILSTTTTSLAFLTICLSHTPAIRSLGLLSAVGTMASGIGAIVLLMPLLVVWGRSSRVGETGHLGRK
jgi:predicted RND superfamily exporter protein